MNNNPLKIFFVSGQFSKVLSIRISEKYAELNKGQWQVSLNSISYEMSNNEKINDFVAVSCNLCRSFVYNETNQEKHTFTILDLVQLKANVNEKKQSRFSLNWFFIDNCSDILNVYLSKWPGQTQLPFESTVTVSILMRKI